MTHICVIKLIIIGSDNGLTPSRRQAIIWTNAGILLSGPLGTNFSEIFIEIYTFSFKKMYLKVSSGKWRPFFLGLIVLKLNKQPTVTAPPFTVSISFAPDRCLVALSSQQYPAVQKLFSKSWLFCWYVRYHCCLDDATTQQMTQNTPIPCSSVNNSVKLKSYLVTVTLLHDACTLICVMSIISAILPEGKISQRAHGVVMAGWGIAVLIKTTGIFQYICVRWCEC